MKIWEYAQNFKKHSRECRESSTIYFKVTIVSVPVKPKQTTKNACGHNPEKKYETTTFNMNQSNYLPLLPNAFISSP
jgi:hypothetical protein